MSLISVVSTIDRADVISNAAQIANSLVETTILSADTSGLKHDISLLVITNRTDTAVTITFKDGTGGTTKLILNLAGLGGAVIPFPMGSELKSSGNNAWTATLSVNTVTVDFLVVAIKV